MKRDRNKKKASVQNIFIPHRLCKEEKTEKMLYVCVYTMNNFYFIIIFRTLSSCILYAPIQLSISCLYFQTAGIPGVCLAPRILTEWLTD